MKLFIIMATLLMTLNVEAKCKNLSKVVSIGTEVIADSFECRNLQAVREDITQTVEISGICDMGFPMGNVKPKTLCKALGGYAGVLTVNEIPEKWDCMFVPQEQMAYGLKLEVIKGCLNRL